MFLEDNNSDFVDVKRLGEYFSEENIMARRTKLTEANLPVIPYPATLGELSRVLGEIDAEYAPFNNGLGYLKAEKRKKEAAYQDAYSEAYRHHAARLAGATQAVLKMTAEAADGVKEKKNELIELQCRIDIIEARIETLVALSQDVRKMMSALMTEMEKMNL